MSAPRKAHCLLYSPSVFSGVRPFASDFPSQVGTCNSGLRCQYCIVTHCIVTHEPADGLDLHWMAQSNQFFHARYRVSLVVDLLKGIVARESGRLCIIS